MVGRRSWLSLQAAADWAWSRGYQSWTPVRSSPRESSDVHKGSPLSLALGVERHPGDRRPLSMLSPIVGLDYKVSATSIVTSHIVVVDK